jgi:hypothetical protein
VSGNTCPILLAGLMGKEIDAREKDEQARCIGSRCAWWNEEYGMCFIEMIRAIKNGRYFPQCGKQLFNQADFIRYML